MTHFHKLTTIGAAAVVAAAFFAMSDRLPAQSATESQPSPEASDEEDVLEFTVALPAESQTRKLQATKTLDQVRELYNRTFARDVLLTGRESADGSDLIITGRAHRGSDGGGGPMPGAMGMPGMTAGMSDMAHVMMSAMSLAGPREQALNKINDLREKLKAASAEDRRKIEEQLRGALSEYFLIDMQLRVKELDEIKARVEQMDARLQKRLDSREEAVELQLKLFLRDADGLGFFRSEDSPAK